ncbi:DNA-binding NarL/FixJ family response regulator [Parabacteroides sp. PF5-5]|uniref:response regulator transcription factor n=1 Tax=unclassified Parabacteroides TaxID=2649774 RepID=UPI0024759CED|nr:MULTISPECIES: LuxR C-terminal-related transcriptional regulator [unclassified Parabacteroides]MDH6305070.1 DNA-binding NarL/FixJ family response regulator [Parabacteroides sp. PH5-39]MDH6315845.1 DNA-binding NarL/FixJ family response regulator [Parabacteroides sp. PF5-13]MDH6319502.1 DNA-binding NarL/FixJ family response regulator [Parabacteroides sp. PH5-13]MDH6323233.1 DNA-binding NarL/FixJ family response regulator [Parabacteroides sp. PH5-8]MDH6327259.1 DNA-binding NarL/FixJ family resp
MKSLKVTIVESSVIVCSGLEVQLKKLPGFRIQLTEISDTEYLGESLRLHKPDILIINPVAAAGATPQQFKQESGNPDMKCVALLSGLTNKAILRFYDGKIGIYDTLDEIRLKLEKLCAVEINETEDSEEQQTLSVREKEIVVCVVKGMTNREIADRLYLSTHTVITHRRNIARKLQIHSASGLTVYAIVNKLVELSDIGKS